MVRVDCVGVVVVTLSIRLCIVNDESDEKNNFVNQKRLMSSVICNDQGDACCVLTHGVDGGHRDGWGYVNVKGGAIVFGKQLYVSDGGGGGGMPLPLLPYSPCPLPCPLGGLDGVALPFALTLCHALL